MARSSDLVDRSALVAIGRPPAYAGDYRVRRAVRSSGGKFQFAADQIQQTTLQRSDQFFRNCSLTRSRRAAPRPRTRLRRPFRGPDFGAGIRFRPAHRDLGNTNWRELSIRRLGCPGHRVVFHASAPPPTSAMRSICAWSARCRGVLGGAAERRGAGAGTSLARCTRVATSSVAFADDQPGALWTRAGDQAVTSPARSWRHVGRRWWRNSWPRLRRAGRSCNAGQAASPARSVGAGEVAGRRVVRCS